MFRTCGNSPDPFIGIGYNGAKAELLYLCEDELVHGVRVQRVDSVDQGHVTGPILWEIESDSGRRASRITIGEAPQGFDVITPLTGVLPLNEEVQMVLQSPRGHSEPLSVKLSELAPDEVAVYFGEMPRSEFEDQQFGC